METVGGDGTSEQVPSSPSSVWSESSRSSFNGGVSQSESDSSSVWSASPRGSFNGGVTQSETDSSAIPDYTSDFDAARWSQQDRDVNGRGIAVAQGFYPEKSEMQAVFDRFDENNDGLICAEDLVRFVKRLGFCMSVKEARSLVRSVDHNLDGKLDFEEFYSLYSSLAGSLKDERRQAAMKKELHVISEEEDETLLHAFRVYDADKNGYISVKELHTVLKSMGLREGQSIRCCERVITRIAANPKEGINLEEFKAMMSSRLESPEEP